MSTTWVITFGSIAWTALFMLLVDLVFGADRRIKQRVREASSRNQPDQARSVLFRDVQHWRGNSTWITERFRQWCQVLIDQSGLELRCWHIAATCVTLMIVSGGLALLLTNNLLAVAAIALVSSTAPLLTVWLIRMQRIETIRQQLPEAFELMSRSIRAGQSVAGAFQIVANESRDPIASEFALCCDQQNLGLPHDESLRDLARRVPIVELNIFVITLLLQRQSGGSPVEILENMADMVRKRLKLKLRIRALTAEGRMQALALGILPVATFFGLTLFRPDYVQPLWDRPQLLLILAAMQLTGTIWVRRIVQLDF